MLQKRLDIPVFYGVASNLTRINLELINGEIVRYKGTNFRNRIKTLLLDDLFQASYSNIISESGQHITETENIRRYVILPIDVNKPFLKEDWYHFFELLLAIFPSDFIILEHIHLELIGSRYQFVGKYMFSIRATGENYFDNFLYISKYEFQFVNRFIAKYFRCSQKMSYLKYILSIYANSYKERNPIYQFISLMICLEVIVDGKEQLTYRLKRNVAILCGGNTINCRLIYSNLSQLYNLRSAIIHGEIKPSYRNFNEYHTYLKFLVAKLIRELIFHNIPTIQELNERLTELGYGQHTQLSADYRGSKYPLFEMTQLSGKKLAKY